MTKNITISVPDELGAKVEKWRDGMNISKVCQKALETEIAKLEDFPEFGKDLEKTLERLRTEKETSYRVGLEVGVEYTKNKASLAELRGLQFGAIEFARLPSSCKDMFERLSDGYRDKGRWIKGEFQDLPLNEKEYTRGCRDGIRSVWKVLSDKV